MDSSHSFKKYQYTVNLASIIYIPTPLTRLLLSQSKTSDHFINKYIYSYIYMTKTPF